MNMKEIAKGMGALLLTGVCVSGSAFAAENAEGVNEHFIMTIDTVKAAQAAAAAGNKEACLTEIKQAKQHYKEITGAASGMPLQKAMQKVKVAQAECEAGNTAKGAEVLSEVVSDLQAIKR